MASDDLRERLRACVKPLNFVQEQRGAWFARPDEVHRYSIRAPSQGFPWRGYLGGGRRREFQDFSEAIAAAQADHADRILSALDLPALARMMEGLDG